MEIMILFIVSAAMTSVGMYCFGKARDEDNREYGIAGLIMIVLAGSICLYRTIVGENMLFAITGTFCLFELGDFIYRLFSRRDRY